MKKMYTHLSRLVGKPTICIGENKDADQLRGNLFFLNPKFQASSFFLCSYRPVCVGPVRKPHCWFSHEVAHLFTAFVIHVPLLKVWQENTQIRPLCSETGFSLCDCQYRPVKLLENPVSVFVFAS